MNESENAADHAILVAAVRDGGAIALDRFGSDQKVWRKSKFHPVCEADLEVNALLQERLCGPRPG